MTEGMLDAIKHRKLKSSYLEKRDAKIIRGINRPATLIMSKSSETGISSKGLASMQYSMSLRKPISNKEKNGLGVFTWTEAYLDHIMRIK